MLNLYVGYDKCSLSPEYHNLTTFQRPYGTLCLVTLPMGWANSIPIFHDNITFILQPEIPNLTIPFIDDVGMQGPATYYLLLNRTKEWIPRWNDKSLDSWEHFQDLNWVVQRIKYLEGTFSRHKLILCAENIIVVGHPCTPQGHIPDTSQVNKIANWGPCKDLSKVHSFLSAISVCRIFIPNFTKHTNALVQLMRKDIPFVFRPAQIVAQEDLKQVLLNSTALQPINYESSTPIILAVNTSPITIGFYICQEDESNPCKCYYTRFGSIPLNNRERQFLQPKLEPHSLFHALRAYKMFLIGVCNFVVEVDARYIQGMLNHPDIALSASMNR